MNDDVITLRGIEAFGYHGVLPEEREHGQPFITDVELHLDASAAAQQDDLALTVDYSAVAADVLAIVEGEPRQLIETVAERIAGKVLTYRPVRSVRVTVHKPQAPVGVAFADVSVTVVRSA
ncbi:MAG: dihydroneopterin aldolase [Actinomycetes bacterium]